MLKEKKLPRIQSLGEITEGIIKDISLRSSEDNHKYSTGFSEIDNVISAIRKNRLYVIGGRSSIGKTAFMCNLAFNLSDRHCKVMFFSLEMSKEEIAQRLVCMGQFIKYGLFELDHLSNELKEGVDKFNKMTTDGNMAIIDSFGYNFDDFSEFIEKLNPLPDVIFIDHIQMSSSVGYRSKYEAMSEYIRKLKELAITKNIAIVVASQINRTAGEDKPKISQLKESGTIEETADVIFLCHWPYLYGASEDKHEYYILIGKNRFGRTKSQDGVRLCFEPVYYKFKDYKAKNEII